MPLAAFKLEALPIPRKWNSEEKRGGKWRVVKDSVLDEKGEAYPLAQDVVQGSSAEMNWERVNVLDYVGFGKYLVANRFGVLPENGRDFCIETKQLSRLTAYGAFSQQECSWGPPRGLELEQRWICFFARDSRELVYSKWLDKLYYEGLSGLLPIIRLAYCCFLALYDRK